MPYIVLGVCNCVVELAFPAKLPVTLPTTLPVKLPVTFPVTLPVKDAVTFPALKFPLASLLTSVLTVLVEVADAVVLAMVVIVEEFTPPTVFTLGTSAVPPKSPANSIIPFSVDVAPVAELDI